LPYYGFYSHIHLTYQNFLNELNKYLRLLIEHHKNNLQLLPAYYLKTAPLLEEKFLFPLALEYYEYVMSQSPFKVEQADASLRAGLLYAQLQDYPKAISLLDNSNLLLPNLMIHYHKAKVYRKTEDSMKSNAEVSIFLKSLDSLILKNENDPRLYYFKGLGLELIQDSKELIEYYQSVIEKGKFDIPIRTIFQRKINNLLDPPRREIISSQNFNCPVCKSNEFIFYTYRDQVVGSIKPKESLNTVYYYLQVLRKICNHCQFEFKEYKSWEDIDFDTQI
ncbi:MAG TPA: hypothetical protein PKX55_23775, partial [Leptospiraceae bacterium]|nr:hypothetical protein [Leptospiraceae bacterium]